MEPKMKPFLLDYEMSIKTIRLERDYERALANSAQILDVEKDRVRRMEHLLLRFESEDLRSQLGQANLQLSDLSRIESDTLVQLNKAYQEIDRLNRHFQTSFNENEKLKKEVSMLSNTSEGYKSLLSEKMQLTRDVSSLKSELDQTKTQTSLQQTSVLGRQEMERQTNSLTVQLEDEKHAHERTRAKNLQQATEIDTLAARLQGLQSEVSKQSKVQKHHEREIRQHEIDWEKQRAVLENRIETLRKQLRSAKDKLQVAQNDLHQKRSNAGKYDVDVLDSSEAASLQRAELDANRQGGVTIATPGAVRVQETTKRQSALPGDKSAFSITPFLNRTGATRDSPDSSDLSEVDNETAKQTIADNHSPLKIPTAHTSGAQESSPLNQQVAARALANRAKSNGWSHKKTFAANESASQPKEAVNRSDVKIPLKEPSESHNPPQQGHARPRKRKLGAQRDRNLFEEEEEEEEETIENPKQGRKIGLGAGRPSVLGTGQVLGTSTGDRLPKALGLGVFSPLKRDRKR